MTSNEIKVLLIGYLDDIEVPDELIEEIEGFMDAEYDAGYEQGYSDGYDEGYMEEEDEG